MTRVKAGKTTHKKRKGTLQHTKGFRWGRRSKFKQAKEALAHAWTYSFRDRKNKKRSFRRLWQIRINASARNEGLSYSDLIHRLKERDIGLDRKVLSELAEHYPEAFKGVAIMAKR